MSGRNEGIKGEVFEYLACPDCSGGLSDSGDSVVCGGCKKEFQSPGGVLDFVCGGEDNIEYIKDVDFEDMEKFKEMSAAIQDHGIEKGKEIIKERFPMFYNYLFEEGRADWRFYLDLDSDSRVLDLGCGWGNLSFELASEYENVTAVDYSLSKLSFVRSRILAEGVNNIRPVRADINSRLPFRDNSFNLVVLNGVLEWAGAYKYEKRPEEYQEDLLREINRVLKPDGYLYIAIENRYGFNYFLWSPDDHTGLRYTNLMPRPMANWYMKKKTKKEYRTYTYSYNALKKFLTRTGFDRYRVLLPTMNYKYYGHIVPLSSPEGLAYFISIVWKEKSLLKKGIQKLIFRCPYLFQKIFKHFTPCFGAIVRKAH